MLDVVFFFVLCLLIDCLLACLVSLFVFVCLCLLLLCVCVWA